MTKRLFFLFFALLVHNPGNSLYAGAPGSSSFAFLKLTDSPGIIAAGGAGIAGADGLIANANNPAALAAITHKQAAFSYGRLLDVMDIGHLGFGLPTLRHGSFAIAIDYLSLDPIKGYTDKDLETGSVPAGDTMLTVAWGNSLSRSLSVGAGIKLINEKLDNVTASAQAADIGAIYEFVSAPGLAAGFAIRNLGPSARFIDKKERLPLTIAAGLQYKMLADCLRLSLDVARVSDRGEAAELHLGAGYTLKELLTLRAGYSTGQDIGPGLAGGAGFNLLNDRLILDYSFSPFSDLGDSHRMALSFKFGGGRAEALYQEGLVKMRQELYSEAILLFDKALTIQPDLYPAARHLKEAAKKLKARITKDTR